MLKIVLITLLASALVHGVPFTGKGAEKFKETYDRVVDSASSASKITTHEVVDSLKETGQSIKNATILALDASKHVIGTTFNVVTAPARKVGRFFKNIFDKKDK